MTKKTPFSTVMLILILQLPVVGQVIVQRDDYTDFKIGIYKTKSSDKDIIGLKPLVIEPQTKIIDRENTAFLKVEDNVIALFENVNDKGINKPVGILTKTSVIEVDTVFYREIYKDPTKEWFLTFNVWYAITINGQKFYTDYKIHDFIAFEKKLDKFNQEFLLVSQNTGYDGYYDVGYPEYFFVLVLNAKKSMVYESKILDFENGDEFWEPDYVKTQFTDNGFEFVIDKYKAVWTGKDLIK